MKTVEIVVKVRITARTYDAATAHKVCGLIQSRLEEVGRVTTCTTGQTVTVERVVIEEEQ